MVVEAWLGVGGFNVDRGAEMTVVDADIKVQKIYVGGGNVPGEVDERDWVPLGSEGSSEV